VAVVFLGRVREEAPKEQLYETPRHPYTVALLSAAPAADPDAAAARQRVILTGDVPSPIDPPPGCRFHRRCPKAQPLCATDEPMLLPEGLSTTAERTDVVGQDIHLTACHFPVAVGENLATAGAREPA